jgi:hypothetical protein
VNSKENFGFADVLKGTLYRLWKYYAQRQEASGHDFSRAANGSLFTWALAPEGEHIPP